MPRSLQWFFVCSDELDQLPQGFDGASNDSWQLISGSDHVGMLLEGPDFSGSAVRISMSDSPWRFGAYRVVARNRVGSASSRWVRVSRKRIRPYFVSLSRSPIVVPYESDVEVSARCVGWPRPRVSWRLRGVTVENAPPSRQPSPPPGCGEAEVLDLENARPRGPVQSASLVDFDAVDTTLALSSFTSEEPHDVQCVGVNDEGECVSDVVVVHLEEVPPWFTVHPFAHEVDLGSAVTLVARARGMPAVDYCWELNGAVVEGAVACELTLDPVSRENIGSYVCIASNRLGRASSDAGVVSGR